MKTESRVCSYSFALIGLLLILTASLETTAQNYTIAFTAAGIVTTIDSVKVENITQGTSLTIYGNDSLHLIGTVGIPDYSVNEEEMKIYPNPMYGHAELSFYAKETGNVRLKIYDISGKQVLLLSNVFFQGTQKCCIAGLKQGMYFVNISGENYFYTAKIISLNTTQSEAKIECLENGMDNVGSNKLKRTKLLVNMSYTTGDTLLFTGFSGIYSSMITDVPTSGKTITFIFISIPTVTTAMVTSITTTTATSGGNIISDGGATVTARGVCWSTTINPLATGNHTTDGTGTGTFTSNISGLTASTIYYIRAYATNSVGTAYGNELTFPTTSATLSIGDNYQGGIVAYILQAGDPGYDSSMQHGLIAAAVDQSNSMIWYNGVWVTTGATATALGTGNANTNTIVGVQGTGSYAAKLCYDLVLNGYSDWYLPSKDELNKLYQNSNSVGGFANGFYWSSTENSSDYAWGQVFSNGNQSIATKYYSNYVRAIRAF